MEIIFGQFHHVVGSFAAQYMWYFCEGMDFSYSPGEKNFFRSLGLDGSKNPKKTKGTPADPKDARILTLAPHGTLIDGFVLLFHARYHALPSPISAKENLKIPIMGQLLSVGKPIFVDRDDLNSKNFVMNEIKKRAEDLDYPQVAIFPEGTLTNSKALMTFKPGAFGSGCAVQPIILRFSGWNTYSWTFGQNPTNLGKVEIQ